MGVPKFYRWISERYPCLSQVVKDYQVRNVQHGIPYQPHVNPEGYEGRSFQSCKGYTPQCKEWSLQ